jgi:hypothetical protein
MRSNTMSDVQCEQRGRSMGVSWSATLSVTDESRGVRGGDVETVRLVGRARKLIRVGTIKNPDGYEGSGRLGAPQVGAGSLRKLAMMFGFTLIPDSRQTSHHVRKVPRRDSCSAAKNYGHSITSSAKM